MNLHEYQAKKILGDFGIPVPRGVVVDDAAEAAKAFRELGAARAAVKAQIHAGGRGKAGGIQLVSSTEEAVRAAERLLGSRLVTAQTGPGGRPVDRLLIEEAVEVRREFYASVLADRSEGCPVVLATRAGGMEIEEVAKRQPELILRERMSATLGLSPFQARRLAHALAESEGASGSLARVLEALPKVYLSTDANLVEINPLGEVEARGFIAMDAKINLDDRALYRHPDLEALRDRSQEDPQEFRAEELGLSYVSLDGDIGCMVNGAGLAMSTMDLIKVHGGTPANFLDVGGGANQEQITAAFKLLLQNPNLKAILVNIFGGIMRCDLVARGIVDAAKEIRFALPLVVRLEGTNVEEGRKILSDSGLRITALETMEDAARAAVTAAKR